MSISLNTLKSRKAVKQRRARKAEPSAEAAGALAPAHAPTPNHSPTRIEAEAAMVEVLDGGRLQSIARELGCTTDALTRSFRRIPPERKQEIIAVVESQKLRIRFKAHDTLEQLFDLFNVEDFGDLPSDMQAQTIRDLSMAVSKIETTPPQDAAALQTMPAGKIIVIQPASADEWEQAVRGDIDKFNKVRVENMKPAKQLAPAPTSAPANV